MSDRVFLDSNIAIYALDPDSDKGRKAVSLLKSRPTISTQVLMETINVLIRKLRFDRRLAFEHARYLSSVTDVVPVTSQTVLKAIELAERYEYSHWDSLVIAAALESGCQTIFTEDLHAGQKLENLEIIDPFR